MDKKRLNKQQYAYQVLRTRILDGTYAPGYRIVINQIANELSLSAIPVREAIRQLEADGLIEYKPYSGAVVTPIDENEYVEAMTVLAVTEGYATALSAQGFSRDKLSELHETNERMERALKDYDFATFAALNRTFHEEIYTECENRYLIEQIEQTWNRLDSIRRQGAVFIPQRAEKSIAEHRQLLTLIEQERPFDEIETHARQHKMNTVDYFNRRKGKKEFFTHFLS